MRFHVILIPFAIALTPGSVVRTVAQRTDACRITIDGKIVGPSADICEIVARRWYALQQTMSAPGALHLVSGRLDTMSPPPGEWIFEWPRPTPTDRGIRTRSDHLLSYDAENLIPHEIGHQLFMVLVGPIRQTSVAPSRYGSPVPDWIDEAYAIWMESREERFQRVKRAVERPASLATLVTMAHPNTRHNRELENPSVARLMRTTVPPCARCTFLPESLRSRYRITDFRTHHNGKTDTLVWYSDRNPTGETTEDLQFYGLSYSLLRFIRTKGGTRAVETLISRYRADPTPRTNVLESLPGLPKTFADFERAWQAFLKNYPDEDP